MQRGQFLSYKRRLFSKYLRQLLPLFFLFPVIVSCGGGGEGLLAGGGIGGTGNTSVGPITALGSIFVNDIEFQTTNATVTINGVNSSEKELQVGMVVKVEGTVNGDGKTGIADMVIFDHNAAGPISSIDLGSSTLEVMGQTVVVDAQTIITGLPGNTPGLADLATNDLVEISGLPDADGDIIATRINLKTAGSQPDVRGQVSSLTSTTFKINALAVDYSKAMLRKFGPVGIQPGDIIHLTGQLISRTTLLADVIEKISPDFKDNTNITFEGFIDSLYYTDQLISGFTIITQFGLQRVELDASTIFSGVRLIKRGAKIQAEGIIRNNIIQAKKLKFLENVRIK